MLIQPIKNHNPPPLTKMNYSFQTDIVMTNIAHTVAYWTSTKNGAGRSPVRKNQASTCALTDDDVRISTGKQYTIWRI
jgi:hypothetical protein